MHQMIRSGVTRYRAKTLMPVNPNRLLKIITAARTIVISSTCPQP
jgi:hypothetical protein